MKVDRQNFAFYMSPEDPGLNHYTFTCPTCGETVTREATAFVTAQLLAYGIEPRPYSPGAELSEKARATKAPPIDEDFIIDFMVEVERYNRGERSLHD